MTADMRRLMIIVESAGRGGGWHPVWGKPIAHFYHATPMYRWERIQQEGLVPSSASHVGRLPGVYLTHQIGVAEQYAEVNFGEDEHQRWAILRIDTKALNPDLLRADDGHETQMAVKDIVARGYTAEQVYKGEFPWWVSLEETGQAVYEGPIPPAAIRVERVVEP